jgi:cytochrome c oxidase subunit 2
MRAGVLVLWWVVLTAALLLAVSRFTGFPLAAAREAAVADHAFRFLLLMATPVFALVVAVLLYSVTSRRGEGDPPEAPPYVPEHPAVPRAWFVLTAALAAYVIYNPGLVGLAEMREVPLAGLLGGGPAGRVRLASLAGVDADLVVRVRASRWLWQFEYPALGITGRELVLPVGRRVRFEVTSVDIVHSFWVPAFRTKIDAVPNLVTYLHVTPTRPASFEGHVDLRVQCAELCGVGHALMTAPVRLLPPEAFDAWAAQQARR